MKKKPLAIVTMTFNEPDFLPIWLKYYMQQVPVESLYIVDHGSTDNSTFGLGSVNVVRIPRSPLDETQRAAFITEFCNSLLHWYDAVAYTDIDEILVADPRHYENLVSLSMNTSFDIVTAFGMHLAHYLPVEPDLVPMAPILQQRHWALGVGSMSKPTLIHRPVKWAPGFHYADAPTEFCDLFLFHLAYCDIPMVRRRQKKRISVERTSNHGDHHGTSEKEFVRHLESWSNQRLFAAVDLGRDCPTRAQFVSQLFATRGAGNNAKQIDAMVNGPGLWKIPNRFLDCF